MILYFQHSSSDLSLPFLLQDGDVVVNKDGCVVVKKDGCVVVNKDTPGGTESEDIWVLCERDRGTFGEDGSGGREEGPWTQNYI